MSVVPVRLLVEGFDVDSGLALKRVERSRQWYCRERGPSKERQYVEVDEAGKEKRRKKRGPRENKVPTYRKYWTLLDA